MTTLALSFIVGAMDKRTAKRIRQRNRRREGRDSLNRHKEQVRKVRGRPKSQTPAAQIEAMAALGHTKWEMAVILGVSEKTLRERLEEPEYQAAYLRGLGKNLGSLRRLQMKHAKSKNGTAMTIHLSKHVLGEYDKAMVLNLSVEDVDMLLGEMERKMIDASKTIEGTAHTDNGGERSEAAPAAPASAGTGSK